ncbi:MAG: hypothetical protein ACRDZ3_17705 [Acidimicrobiia bacterium]
MTWILAGATVMLLSAIAVSYRRADRDRCRATHPTALRLAYPLPIAANGDTPVGAASGVRRRERHLVAVPSAIDDVSCRR